MTFSRKTAERSSGYKRREGNALAKKELGEWVFITVLQGLHSGFMTALAVSQHAKTHFETSDVLMDQSVWH